MPKQHFVVLIVWASTFGSGYAQPKVQTKELEKLSKELQAELKKLPKELQERLVLVDATSISAHSSHILNTTFSKDSKTLLTVGHGINRDREEDTLKLWDVASKELKRGFRAGGNRTERFLSSGAAFVCFFEQFVGWEIARFEVKSGERSVLHVSKHLEHPVLVWPDQGTAVVEIHAGTRHDLKFAHYEKSAETVLEVGESFKVLGFSPDKQLVALNCEGKIKIFDWEKRKKICEFAPTLTDWPSERIAHWFITSDNKFGYLGVEGSASRIEKWDLAQGKLVKTVKDPYLQLPTGYAVITPDDRHILAGNRIINLETGKVGVFLLRPLVESKKKAQFTLTTIAISPDGRTCANGYSNGEVWVYPMPTLREEAKVEKKEKI